jgi:hypothetical protein
MKEERKGGRKEGRRAGRQAGRKKNVEIRKEGRKKIVEIGTGRRMEGRDEGRRAWKGGRGEGRHLERLGTAGALEVVEAAPVDVDPLRPHLHLHDPRHLDAIGRVASLQGYLVLLDLLHCIAWKRNTHVKIQKGTVKTIFARNISAV